MAPGARNILSERAILGSQLSLHLEPSMANNRLRIAYASRAATQSTSLPIHEDTVLAAASVFCIFGCTWMFECCVEHRLDPLVWCAHIPVVMKLSEHEDFVLGHVWIVVPLLLLAELDAHVVLPAGDEAIQVLGDNVVHFDSVRVADRQWSVPHRALHREHGTPEVNDTEAFAGPVLELRAPLIIILGLRIGGVL
eukprot:CAMPEP_0179025036 /NCGR_PEP_ID=MMETSP0796-20121207/7768_1 /TAXON_ID=73915 /ORGANISM="Pyrodinium bahamense, Strain pbaha01" /LENGTH=194 /DNA_ID=CAMNT_0020721025 /DNA_START=140 /DNA_END=724 /DNA_ORIENTATION=-